MANYVEGDEGAATTDDSEIAKWLKTNNLQKLIPKFESEDMTLQELIEFSDDTDLFDQYLKGLQIPQTSIYRIKSRINQTKKQLNANNNDDNNNNSKSKIVRIIVSAEEEKAITKLNEYTDNLSSLINTLSDSNNKIITVQRKYESDIKQEFKNLINTIKNKETKTITKLKNIATQKQSEINAKSQQLQSKQENAKNAIKTCNGLIENSDMDRFERKKKILSTSNNIINQKISNNITDVSTDIVFQFNKDSISSFVSHLADVYGEEKYPLPIINNVECKSITSKECTMHWDAALSKQDMNAKSKSKLFIKVQNMNDNIDEKEKEQINSSLIPFNKNKKHYQYKMNKLQKNTEYKMQIILFESHKDNNTTKRGDAKPILFDFKTAKLDGKNFIYQSDFDTNGICFALGSDFGKKTWSNPGQTGLVKLKSSGWNGAINNVVSRTTASTSWSNDAMGSWVSIDFGKTIKIKPTAYTLRNGGTCSELRNWNLEGSNDGLNWRVIKLHQNDTGIQKGQKGATHTWSITGCNESYQMFKIQTTGKCASDVYYLTCSGFEIYGHLTKTK